MPSWHCDPYLDSALPGDPEAYTAWFARLVGEIGVGATNWSKLGFKSM
jgi:hypothetical protein